MNEATAAATVIALGALDRGGILVWRMLWTGVATFGNGVDWSRPAYQTHYPKTPARQRGLMGWLVA